MVDAKREHFLSVARGIDEALRGTTRADASFADMLNKLVDIQSCDGAHLRDVERAWLANMRRNVAEEVQLALKLNIDGLLSEKTADEERAIIANYLP